MMIICKTCIPVYILKSIQSHTIVIFIICILYDHKPCKLLLAFLLAAVRPSFALLSTTNHPKAVGGVCHATNY